MVRDSPYTVVSTNPNWYTHKHSPSILKSVERSVHDGLTFNMTSWVTVRLFRQAK